MKRLLIILSLIGLANIFFSQSGWCSRIKVYADLDKPIILAGSDERVVVKVGLLPQEDSRQKRLPLNIAVVLDKSGSMASNQKMENAKRGVIEIIQRMEKDDIFSLITYDTQPRILIPAQTIEDKDSLIDSVWSITAGGSTALYGGVELGAVQVRRHLSAPYLNRVILLSDGLANVGPQNTEDLAELGNRLSREGITVSTIGLGLDYNEDLMAALAQEGEGNSYFSRNSDELPMIFAEEIGEAATLLAQNINVAVECAGGVAPSAILGRKGAVHRKSMSAGISSLYGRNEKYALFEIRPPQGEDGSTITLATVNVEYYDPFTKKRVTETKIVSVRYDRNRDTVSKNERKDIIKEVELTRVSEIKRQAVTLADQGNFRSSSGVLKEKISKLEETARKCDNDKDLLQVARELEQFSSQIIDNKGMSKYQRKRFINDAATQVDQQGYVSRSAQ